MAAVGINCFFSGSSAANIEVSDYVKDTGRHIASSRSPDQNGNSNAVLLATLGDRAMTALGSHTMKDYYRQIAVGVGNQISVTSMRLDNTDGVLRSLTEQREVIKASIYDQASLMMLYERMFQAGVLSIPLPKPKKQS